ncbi:MAG: aminodeoxychorismate/anthranilate synthase component II [Euryarchaeota archaeon]|nr:aminodeoxychorismate/anthranilate synthase component II [Euryarchaeota archaeon]
MKLLLLDNYDSFVYNLKQALGELGVDCAVKRNDAIGLEEIKRFDPNAIVVSPGPGHPLNGRDFGICKDVLLELSPEVPTLGVCLGHQGIAALYGSKIARIDVPVHGKASLIDHDGEGLFEGLDNPMLVGRYHSLVVRDLSSELEAVAKTKDGEIMAIRHRKYPIHGVQFHPESVLTPKGKDVLANFIRMSR